MEDHECVFNGQEGESNTEDYAIDDFSAEKGRSVNRTIA